MSLTSAPLRSSPSVRRTYEDGNSDSVYLGRRRVILMGAGLCLYFVWDRSQALHSLVVHWSGDYRASAAIFGNAILLGALAFIAAVALISAALGLPRLIVSQQGLTLQALFRTSAFAWDSLSRFHVERLNGGKIMSVTADIIGPNASPRLRRGGSKQFTLAGNYRGRLELIVADIHDCQTEALGTPAPLPRAGSAPAIRAYGVTGFRAPWATLGLLAVLTATFVAELQLGVLPKAAPLTPDGLTLDAFGGLSRNAVLDHGEWLRLFSSTFLHKDGMHFFGNAATLLLAGWFLEQLVGRSWFLAIFAMSSLAGSVVGLAVSPANTTLIGASGGITGLFAAMVALSFRLPAGLRRTLMLMRATVVLIAVLTQAEALGGAHIAYAAHLGGALTGAALGVLLLSTWCEFCRLPRFQTAGFVAGIGGLVLALLGIPTSLHLSRDFVASVQHCAEKDPDTRIQGCTALLDRGTGNRFKALLNRGRAYIAKGQYDLAIVDLDRGIILAPGSADALLSRGYAYFRKGLHDQSITDFNKAIELSPKFAAAYFERGKVHLDQGLLDRTIADEDQALALDPKLAGTYIIRGLAYSRKGETIGAIADFSKAIALNQGDADTYVRRGAEYLRERRFDEVIADTTKALELRPASAAIYRDRAWALHLKGENALALPDAEEAVTLAPSSAPSLETRAEIYEKLGRRRDAVADYRAALAIDGNLQLARDGLKRLNADPRNSP